MKPYKIFTYAKPNDYVAIIYSTSFENPIDYLEDIALDLPSNMNGLILFDLILSNGFSSNRYISAEYSNKKFNIKSFKIIPSSTELDNRAIAFYSQFGYHLNSHILSDEEKMKLSIS